MSDKPHLRTSAPGPSAVGTPGPNSEDRLREALRAATLGEFEVYDELGRGGMARVYLCYDLALDRHVAIKVMSPTLLLEEGMAERFRREAKISASLSHPNIIPVYTVRQTDELAFFVMKYVDGCTLSFVISEHAPLPVDMVRQVVLQIAGALVYAHGRGVVHRDIKPANILIDSDGRAILTDFGIARSSGLSGLTSTGASVGTPYYMSPEQCSRGGITGQSDQYALGVLAYQMLSGRLPFSGADAGEVMSAHLLDPPDEIAMLRRDCPPDLARAVMRMLAKKPGDRWPSLEEAMAEIRWKQAGKEEETRTQLIALARTSPARPALPSPPTSPAPSSRAIALGPVEAASQPARSGWNRRIALGGVAVLLLAGAALLWRLNQPGAAPAPSPMPQAAGPATQVGADGGTKAPTDSASGSVAAASPPPVSPPPTTPRQSELRLAGPAPAPRSSASVKKGAGKPDTAARNVPVADVKPIDSLAQKVGREAPIPPIEQWAQVLIGTKHEGAVLWINGELRLPVTPSLRHWPVRAGQVTLTIKGGEGCTPWQQTITIAAGDTVRIGNRSPVCPP